MAVNLGVKPKLYVKSMCYRWDELNIAHNQALHEAWYDMADTFNRHIRGEVSGEWSVLQLPTGSGKTQGLAVYCFELTKLEQYPGILIITRFKEEANTLASTINKLAKKEIAHARHGDNKGASKEELAAFPVLIITHRSYALALGSVAENEDSGSFSWSWPMYYKWKDGTRALTIIDETLNALEPVKLELDDLRLARSIPFVIEAQYPKEIRYLNDLLSRLTTYAEKTDNKKMQYLFPSTWQFKEDSTPIIQEDLTPLIDALRSQAKTGRKKKGEGAEDAEERSFKATLKQKQVDVLEKLTKIVSDNSLYARQGNSRAVQMARIALPTHINSAVILDATASYSFAYNMVGTFVKRHPLPKERIRNYKNVSLHIIYGLATGQDFLSSQSPEFFLHLMGALEPPITGRQTLICTHKKAKSQFSLVEKQYPQVALVNWGAIDGRNDWEKFEAVVLCGLPRLGSVNAECAVLAFEAWHKKGEHLHNPNVCYNEDTDTIEIAEDDDGTAHNRYEQSHVAVSIIQAINRVRCRRSIDTEGNCEPTDVYLFLCSRGGELGQYILDNIREAMPGLVHIAEHDVPEIIAPEKLSDMQGQIIQFFRNKKSGEYPAKIIYKETKAKEISKRTLELHMREMREHPDSLFSRKMQEVGVSYIGGRGKPGEFKKA